MIACTLITVAPWTVRNAVEFGRFIPVTSSTGFALAGTYNEVSLSDDEHPASWRTPVVVPEYKTLFQTPGVDEGTLDATLRREAGAFAWDHPGYVMEAAGWNLLRLFDLAGGSVVGARGVEGGVVAAPGDVVEARGIGTETGNAERAGLALAGALALVGVFALVRSRVRRGADEGGESSFPAGPWFLWLVPLVMIIAAAPVSGVPRYRLPADPFLLMLAAIGAVWIADCLRTARARRGARLASSAAVIAAAAALVLGGCGGGDDGEPAPAPGDGAESAELSDEFAAPADAVCRDVAGDARRLGRRVDAIVETGVDDPLALATKGFVEPGVRILERWSSRLRKIEPPADLSEAQRSTLDLYLDLFYPIIELGHLRVRAGEAGDVTEARELEGYMRELAEEQGAAARRLGLQDCAIDFSAELFPDTAQGP